ncbi:MAG TPA: signal peptidase II [Puia sp.]|jgi:signal peptidase II|nr:signal peptidase II [Puia sp.]
MASKKIFRITIVLLLIFTNIGCDQVSKKIIRNNISENQTIGILRNHLIVMRVENAGAFLSFGDSLSKTVKNILLRILPLIALTIALIYVFAKQNISAISIIAICFIIGGGVGNIFDRIFYGSVTDFLYIQFGAFQTGVFNMADLSITSGGVIILLQSLNRSKRLY